MSEGSSNRSPKTLADVSHLFFSNVEERRPTEPRRATLVFIITGSDSGPGKSTVAVNLAQALLRHGRVGLYDADPRVPNARFYLGLPSWNYLSPITGEGVPAPTAVIDSGLIVVDWAVGVPEGGTAFPDSVSVEVPDAGTYDLDFAVTDAPLSRAVSLGTACGSTPFFVIVAEPGLAGFERTFAALARLARDAGAREAGIVVNRAPGLSYAKAFYAKMKLAADRLLSMDTRLLGGVIREPNLGAEQRERGVLVKSRPDAAAALLLKEIAANALSLRGAEAPLAGRSAAPA